jgi:hypothetical protein
VESDGEDSLDGDLDPQQGFRFNGYEGYNMAYMDVGEDEDVDDPEYITNLALGLALHAANDYDLGTHAAPETPAVGLKERIGESIIDMSADYLAE